MSSSDRREVEFLSTYMGNDAKDPARDDLDEDRLEKLRNRYR